jgi:hypothetical protein
LGWLIGVCLPIAGYFMGMSQAEYARYRGVTRQAVWEAVQSGRITLLPDSTIDPVVADRQWDLRTDQSMQRKRTRGAGKQAAPSVAFRSRAVADAGVSPSGTKPVPTEAIDTVRDTLAEQGVDLEQDAEPGGAISFVQARLANEILKAQLQKVKLGKVRGQLVDRAKARQLVFDLARRERDAWIGWPARVAANMAAELGVDPNRMEEVLDRYLREHLSELAEIRVELQ